MANDFSTGKSIFILAIVAGCFAVLWPNVFYPMLQGTFSQKDTLATTQGCCDVMFDSDVNAIKVMTDICEKILARQTDFDSKFLFAFQQGKLTKEIVDRCQKTVHDTCGIDITKFLKDKVRLGRSYKQMLDEIRSLNSSLCLKQFGVSLGDIGLPRLIRVWGLNKPKHLRQERPPHLRPEFLHPALREKGRAIPQSRSPAKQPPPEVRSGTPLPGMRPPMGGPGQVVPPPKGGGTMGIVMPMYTIGIIVFFLYTMMKLLFKKTESSEAYENFTSDPHFQKTVLKDNYSAIQEVSDDGTKIGWRERDAIITAISGLVEEVNRQLRSDQGQQTDDNKQDEKTAGKVSTDKDCHVKENTEEKTLLKETNKDACKEDTSETDISSEPIDDGKSVVKVLGMETTETCERGAKWSRPPTPLSRPSTPLSRPSTPLSRPSTPQNIFIPGSLPSKSQLLVSDSHIETVDNQDDNAVVLTGKVTLSLIGLSENNTPVEEGKKQLPNTETSHKNREPNGTCATPLSGNNKAEVSKLEAEEILDGHEDDK